MFKEVTALDADTIVALGKKDKTTGKPFPKQAEGYYLGSRTVESKRGESKIHFLQTSKGNLGLWGTTDLNRKLGSAPVGTMVRVTSTGTKPTPNGDMYTYKVEVDADNTIVVEAQTETTGTGYTDDDDTNTDDTTDEGNGVDEEAEALLAAEAKARVQAILNRTKTGTKKA